MNTTGSLVLFVGVGILLLAGVYALDDLHGEVNTTGNTELESQINTVKAIENPIFMAFGYGLLIMAAIAVVNSFRSM